ncbi:unnamed protein product [Angiostrongylus costaricensis]|uniref:Glucosidase II subunit alpha n=1 Tax=Angiostrongylus costaricensis TaxID=334426 RepID=A0A158PIJ8_ANGCS|nr:unnamed protein product [Angiostrongylus costaricensis]
MVCRRVVLLVLLIGTLAVRREDFKTCEQSGFCKRHRAISVTRPRNSQNNSLKENTGYELVPQSLKSVRSRIDAILQNSEGKLAFRLYGLKDASVRIQIDESEESIRKRFVPAEALDGEPGEVLLNHAVFSLLTRVVVTFKPFFMDVYNEYGELVAQMNRDGKLKVEQYRVKEEGKEYPENFWEESFKSFTDSKPFGSSSIGVDISFIGFRNAYGLPEHADSFALKSTVGNTDPFRLYNLDVFEYELGNPMSLYLSVPYIVAHRKNATLGALWLNAAETWIDTQSSADSKGLFRSVIDRVRGFTLRVPHFDAHFMSETGIVDVFFFGGPGPRDIQRQLSRITGVTPLPPIFSIGYHQSRWNYNDEEDVDQVNEKFDAYDIPMDVIWLDIEHTEGKRYFTWDEHKFPHPREMVNRVAAKGRKMVTIIDPHIKIDNNYPIYKDAKDLELYVKKSDGSTNFEGHCWPGSMICLSFKAKRDEVVLYFGPEVTMNKDALHFGGIEHREVRLVGSCTICMAYGNIPPLSKAKCNALVVRTRCGWFLLFAYCHRSGFVGTQRTAAVWTGDNTADWDHLAITAAMLLSLSVSGVPFVGADVGGFFGNPDEQLLTRWYQAGSFQPFFRAHAHIDTKRREPWLASRPTMQAIRQAIRRRYALLPYWYTLFREHMITGAPPMRPIWFEFPNEENLYEEEKAWMVGSALLVRPVVEKDTYSVKIVLPTEQNKKTRWFDWESGIERTAGVLHVDVPITHVPVFQRGGTIIPSWQRIRRASTLMIQDPLTLFIALDGKGYAKGSVYLDDGATHDYMKGAYISAEIEYNSFETETWIERIEVQGLAHAPHNISIVRSSDPTDALEFSYNGDRRTLTIRKPLVSITQSYKIHISF